MDKRRIGVRAVIYKDGKILAVKHKSKTGGAKDFWAIPGGGLDPGEPLEAGLKREIYEELGIEVVPGRLLFIQQFTSPRVDCDEELEFFFLVDNPEAFETIDYSGTSHGMEELARCEFIDPANELVLPRFISEVNTATYAEAVQPVLVADLLHENAS